MEDIVPIYTIGYGNRSIESFIQLLRQYEIEHLVDIRSQPYSRYKPEFSKEALEKRLKQSGIHYVFMGDTLGGRPNDSSCYNTDKQVDYKQVRSKPFFQEGIERIRTAWKKQLRVALMCSESKPQECHRSKLVGNTLYEQGINVEHIDEDGKIKEQAEVNQLLIGPIEPPSLFSEQTDVMDNEKIAFSRKGYIRTEKGYTSKK